MFGRAQEALQDLKIGSCAWFEKQIHSYIKIRDKIAKPYWDAAWEAFENEQFSGFNMNATSFGLVQVQPARVFSLVQQIESQVVGNRPKFVADALKARAEELAEWAEALVNADWERTKAMMSQLRLNTRNTILTGWGPMLSGVETDYDAARRDRKRRMKQAERMQLDPVIGEIQAEFIGEAAAGPDSVDEEERETTFEMNDLILSQRVFSRAINPYQFVIDPNASCIEDAEWVGRIIIAQLDAVKGNPNFRNTRDLKANFTLAGSSEAREAISPDGTGRVKTMYGDMVTSDVARCVLYELFVRDRTGSWGRHVLAKDCDKPLQIVDDTYDIGCPYRLQRWNHTSKRIFATSDVQSVMSEVVEEREIRTRLHDQFLRAAVDTYVADKIIFGDDAELHPLTVEGIGNIILGNLNGRPIDSAIGLMKRNGQMGDALQYLSIIERSFQVSTGLGANQMASALKSETSATEAAEIAKWSSARGRSKYAFAEEFAAGVAMDRLGLICQFYDEDDIAAIGGPEAAKFWVKERFTAGDIQAGLSLRVEQGSMQPRDDASVLAMLKEMFLWTITPATAPIANMHINSSEVFQEMLRVMGVQKGSKLAQDSGGGLMQQLAMAMQQMGGGMQGGQGGGGGPPAQSATPSGRAEAAQTEGR